MSKQSETTRPTNSSASNPQESSGLSRRSLLSGALAGIGVTAITGTAVAGGGAPPGATPNHPAVFTPFAQVATTPEEAPLHTLSAVQLATAIRDGKLRSRQVVDTLLDRIEKVNPALNAITDTLADTARSAADAVDRDIAASKPVAALAGVPFTIKNNIDLAGSPTTNGVKEFLGAIPSQDAPIVARLKAAGAIPLARTNMPDYGMRVHTESETHGITRNPWDPSVNVGGSSGGEGAALASGLSPLGLGNDIGGSLRNPAHCCGIASLKPTLGRIPQSSALAPGELLAGQLMSVSGPMARTVADLRLGYEIIAGYHFSDPWSVPVPLHLDRPRPLRVALVPEPPGGDTDTAIADGVRAAGEALAKAGYIVEEVTPPSLTAVAQVWNDFIVTDLEIARPQMLATMGEGGKRFLELAWQIARPLDRAGYSQMMLKRHVLASAWQTFQQRYPLIIGPVFTKEPFPVGYDIENKSTAADVLSQIRFTIASNLLGLPAAVVPVGIHRGLPLAVQIYGDRFLESLCLEAAADLEAAFGTFTPIDPRSTRQV